MQRSDITNINKLFLESKLEQIYMSDWHTYKEVSYIEDRCVTSNQSLEDAAVAIIKDKRLDQELDFSMLVAWVTKDYIIISTADGYKDWYFSTVSRERINKKRMQQIMDDVCLPDNKVKLSELLAKFEYKSTATKDIDPDLGFGDLLDVL